MLEQMRVSQAWKPENGKHYGELEVLMEPDFEIGPDKDMWGIVNCRDLDQETTFERLRIVGEPRWHYRFTWLHDDHYHDPPINYPWQQALGGMSGTTALGGLQAYRSRLRIKRLEVIGVPGAAIYYVDSPGTIVESLYCDRVGWPIYGSFQNWSRASFRNVTSRDHWFASEQAWGSQGQERAAAIRRLEATQGIMARGEAVLCEAGWELLDYTHRGDGVGFKACGTDYTIRGYHGGRAMFNGVVPENLTAYPDPVKWRHLHVAENIVTEDCVVTGSRHIEPYAPLLYISYPFTEPLVLKRWTFVNPWSEPSDYATGCRYAAGQNWAAVHYEDCDFIGWPDEVAAINLSPSLGELPAATATTAKCRFWAC